MCHFVSILEYVFSLIFFFISAFRYVRGVRGISRVVVTGSIWLMSLAWSQYLLLTCHVSVNVELLNCYGRWQARQGAKGFGVCV